MSSLWLVCDVSGSMLEGGKRFIVRTLVYQVAQFYQLGYAQNREIKIVAWNNQIKMIPWISGDEVPGEILDCSGSSNVDVLVQLCGEHVDDQFIVFSDGFWSESPQFALKECQIALNQGGICFVSVGFDANSKLKGQNVFKPEDFFSIAEGWLEK